MSDKAKLDELLVKLNAGKKTDQVLDSPQTIFEGDKLISIDLNDLNITSLEEDTFKDLKSLKKIALSFNEITELPAGIFQNTPDLYFINLYSNNISKLPDTIFEGLTMTWVDLRTNGLETLPKSLMAQEKIELLFLQNNPGLNEFNADYHTKRDLGKSFPEMQKVYS